MSVIPFNEFTKADESLPWNGPEEIAKSTVDDLKDMSAWYDMDNKENKSAYKLPHHRQEDKAVVWNGVAAAMSALLGGRGGVDIPANDRQGVYRHLMKHYDQFKKTAPEFRMSDSNDCKYEFLSTLGESNGTPKLILPIGTHHTGKYGDVTITRDFCEKLIEHYKLKVMGERIPFIDTQHDFGRSNGWIKHLSLGEKGVMAEIEWNELGRSVIKNKIFRYLSCAIDKHIETTTGTTYYPVLLAVSLTNTPVMEGMPAVELSGTTPGHGAPVIIYDGHSHVTAEMGEEMNTTVNNIPAGGTAIGNVEQPKGLQSILGDVMKLSEQDMKVLKAVVGGGGVAETKPIVTPTVEYDQMGKVIAESLKAALSEVLTKTSQPTPVVNPAPVGQTTPAQASNTEQLKTLGSTEEDDEVNLVERLKAELEASKIQNQRFQEQWATLKKKEHYSERDRVIGEAIASGKIAPKARTKWEYLYDKNPEGIKSQLADVLGSDIFCASGTASADDALQRIGLPEGSIDLMTQFGLTTEQIIAGNSRRINEGK